MLDKNYNFHKAEEELSKYWKLEGVYVWDKNEPRENTFVVDTPPPTVSGQLHIGHVFSYTHTDFIVRFQRMRGKNIFYPIGFDDNGLATERLVEKKRKVRARAVGREEFISLCQEVVAEEEEAFRVTVRQLALSVDWSQEYQTISPLVSKMSQMSFLDLLNKGEIYQDHAPMLWDSVDQTAIAQSEIEEKQFDSFMNDIAFKTESGEQIVVATTRPELLPSCVAVFFHPDDSRYKNLHGQHAITPIFNSCVPIIPDELVDPEKGTGLVMCCTFGDITDVTWWKKHRLPMKISIGTYGNIVKLDNIDNSALVNLKIQDARIKVLEMLKDAGVLLKQSPINHSVKCAERSGAPLEILPTNQWFISTLKYKDTILELSQELNWYPGNMKIRLDSWINNVAWDWCISRQRFFGIPIPVWYSKKPGEEGRVLLPSIEQLPINPLIDLPSGYSKEDVDPEVDVFDTWATSAVSPQINSRAISKDFAEDVSRHHKLFPADLRPQGHEILRTWAFYTILKSYLHQKTLPWKNIMISGWCLAEDKTKMSKSKGNIIAPDKLFKQYGADVVRYWAASSKLGSDTAYSEKVMHNGKRLVNKLWNAAKFVSVHFHLITDKNEFVKQNAISHPVDLWIISKLRLTVESATKYLEQYEYSDAIDVAERFFWDDFCDNYLEISKSRVYDEHSADSVGQKSGIMTLYECLHVILRLFAPFIPYITEEIYQKLFSPNKSIHSRDNWPNTSDLTYDEKALREGDALIDILKLVRNFKAQKQISIKAEVKCLRFKADIKLSQASLSDLASVTNSLKVQQLDKLTSTLSSHNTVVDISYGADNKGLGSM